MRYFSYRLLPTLLLAVSLQLQAADFKSNVVPTAVKNPENLLKTNSGRVFMTAEAGIYEVVDNQNAPGKSLKPLDVVFRTPILGSVPAKNSPCYFAGMVQYDHYVIAACAVSFSNLFTPRYLLSLDLDDESKTVREIGRLTNNLLPNGMAIDSQNRIYLSDSGPSFVPGKIERIVFKGADPMLGFSEQAWLYRPGHPNGIKVAGDVIYWTESPQFPIGWGATLYRAPLTNAGAAQAVYVGNCCFDDFTLVKGGAVIADFSAKRLVHVSEEGRLLHSTASNVASPTSVLLESLQTAPWSTLWVTESDSGRLVAISQDWGLQPR